MTQTGWDPCGDANLLRTKEKWYPFPPSSSSFHNDPVISVIRTVVNTRQFAIFEAHFLLILKDWWVFKSCKLNPFLLPFFSLPLCAEKCQWEKANRKNGKLLRMNCRIFVFFGSFFLKNFTNWCDIIARCNGSQWYNTSYASRRAIWIHCAMILS